MPSISEPFHVFDHVAIYLFIAGTVTPIALAALRGRYRQWLLVGIWVMAFTGVAMRILAEPSIPKATLFYLSMGWLGLLTYFELARRLTHAKMRGLWLGGAFYTLGAVINVLHWPILAPGTFESRSNVCEIGTCFSRFSYRYMLSEARITVPERVATPAYCDCHVCLPPM